MSAETGSPGRFTARARRAALVLVLTGLTACGGSGTYTAADPAAPVVGQQTKTRSTIKPEVVAFGDSVPSGAHCSCPDFVDAYAKLVSAKTGKTMAVDNFAVSGSTSADAVTLIGQSKVDKAVSTASTVLIMTGANDYNDAFDQASLGGATAKLYPPVATAVEDNVTTVIDKIRTLNSLAHIVVLDYWAAMEDGAVARKDYDATALAASVACTNSANTALASAADDAGASYVSTLTAFRGSAGSADDTALLGPDGNHPDAAGHALIARTIDSVFPEG